MSQKQSHDHLKYRQAALEMSSTEFRQLGHELVDRIADFLDTLPQRLVTQAVAPAKMRKLLGERSLPQSGSEARALLENATDLLLSYSLFNGHPKFWGYITSSAAPIGALAEMLAATVNANAGAWELSPVASEIEAQTIRWLAEMIGYPVDCGGLLVSGGNMANFVGLLAARKAKAGWDIRQQGLQDQVPLRIYASRETHTWVQKAADLFGLGTDAIRWISVDAQQRMKVDALEQQIREDRDNGLRPLLVVASAGTVSTGAVDPIAAIAACCRRYDLWLHVDGAYGAFAAMLPDAPAELHELAAADSIAIDPHKWLYAPLEAGCTLVRNPRHLVDAFSFRPPYYNFHEAEDEAGINFYEYGMQNSRGFRALKVWLALQQAGRDGYARMLQDDIELAAHLHRLVAAHPELQAFTHKLSITTFRYLPPELEGEDAPTRDYLNELNRAILTRLQKSGEAYVSNAVLDGTFLLRACIVNFRTTIDDITGLPELVVRYGRELHAERQEARSKAA